MDPQKFMSSYMIGLTGGAATGKSFVASHLRSLGYKVYDADMIARDLSQKGAEGFSGIIELFGEGLLTEKGDLDRKKLGALVFEKKDMRKSLELLLHPLIQKRLFNSLEKDGLLGSPEICFYEAALLVEKKKERHFRELWVTHCTQEVQLKRLKKRGLSDEKAKALINSQLSSEEKLKKADFILETNFSKDVIEEQVGERLKLLS